jgi:hypothetical protein
VHEGDHGGQLLPGERVIWSGQPQQGLLLLARDGHATLFTLVWCGGVAYADIQLFGNQNPSVMAIVVLGFMTVTGIFDLAGRFAVDAWLRSKTAYALTNQRILIVRTHPFGAFLALNLDRLPALELIERANSRGTVRFGPALSLTEQENNWEWWLPVLDRVPQFLAIADAQEVFDEIQRASRRITS